ncbi:putative late blight resistance protein homolog R1B-17 [Salvia miltiorrhiza]|uniref:putative late blight resistance protein homolog R1B-17 n=1 Tax=Salvia miltiorrhiza TaxID=226208 RepID=UPI0025AC75A9|nr:putative late blight resistance protein homolog R1B-17 [Salvia miltiorrhiza]XP_057810604.1 putative late blight resistance protein homolog R1B-17 [Salvia miltiorrhiza]XP_057810605.1 putative late blight resistance protein homolog R1B-17 [Salvia miltiorrhiza]
MADAAVEFLLENLKQLLLYNANLILDVKAQVELLYNDLTLFKAFLKDSTEKRSKHETLKELVKHIRNVVYEAEDAIDTFVAHAAVHKARKQIGKAFHFIDYSAKLRAVAQEIQLIRTRVKDIYENKKFGFEALHIGGGSDRPTKEKKPPIVEEDNVVGFEDEAVKVVNLLSGGSDDLEVISIVGMPGLGKTTLAKMVYRDPNIEYQFYKRAWVYVSQDYSRKEVFLNILSNFVQLTDDMHKMNDENLAKELSKQLEKSKYLVVMDDVWTEEAWNDLKIAFPKNNNKGSRILITSRIKKVAKHANPIAEPHNLRFLTPDESWRLLQRKALGSENCPEELVKDGRHIANECRGLPLAIVVIGGVLLEKGTDWWEKVASSVDAYIAMDEARRMDSFIALSYNHLPYHLKACFIYLGMFPEDFEIPVWKLVRLWIAEGFIQQKEGMSLEDIAEEYLEDLVNRNLVMVGQFRSNGKLKTCRIHDMLREFCKKEAAEENFFQEIRRFDQGTYASSNPASEKYRRLSIHSRVLNYISSRPNGPQVRSFLCFSSEETILPAEHISSIPAAFKLLRVLDGRSINYTRFPTDLTQLVHLRYIVLSCNFKIVPAAVSSLWNIQTLVVETASRTLEIKADIWKMIQLRHVKTNASTTLPRPLSKSRKSKDEVLMIGNLQTLSTISPESCTEDVFARAPNLKVLGIRGQLAKLLENKNGSMLFDGLGKLSHLENLKLVNDVFPRPPSEGRLTSLPQRYKFPTKLKKLTLSDTLLDWKEMSTLGMLENLEILKLKDNAFKGNWWKPDDGGFRSLKILHIGRTDLVTWHASAHHFPRLRNLFLKHCTHLESLPLGFAEVSSLQLVDLYCTTSSAATSARTIKQKKEEMLGRQITILKLSIYPPDH